VTNQAIKIGNENRLGGGMRLEEDGNTEV